MAAAAAAAALVCGAHVHGSGILSVLLHLAGLWTFAHGSVGSGVLEMEVTISGGLYSVSL